MKPSARTICSCAVCVLLLIRIAAADDLKKQREAMHGVLNTVAEQIEKSYYDPQMKGLDWKQLTAATHQQIDKATSVADMFTAVFTLVHKLNDSQTVFLPPAFLERSVFGFEAKAYGDEIRVYLVKKDGPAEAAGLKVGDRILRLNNFDAERSSFGVMMLFFHRVRPVAELEVMFQRASGPPQTVRFAPTFKQVKRAGWLTDRAPAEEDTLWQWSRDLASTGGQFQRQFENRVGFIRVGSFATWDGADLRKLGDSKAVIVDLRGNLGGREDTFLGFAGHFVATPSTVAELVGRRKLESLRVRADSPNFANVPVVILVDGETSGEAEMFAKFLQLRGNGVVVGDRTAGRVMASSSFQRYASTQVEFSWFGIFSFSQAPYTIYVSTARRVFSDGSELESKGVVPDVSCVPTMQDLVSREDRCLLLAMSVADERLSGSRTLPEQIKVDVRGLAANMAKASEDAYQQLLTQPAPRGR